MSEFVHFVVGGAHDTEPDAQGRIVVPAHLRRYAGLETEAQVIGVTRWLEVWEPGRWRARLAQVESSLPQSLASLGI
ncbi:MAG: hypothetical protein HY071_03110 [Chloroflexi bacterium]|nr:hypothetical protein [Chloroflexota bacterium]